MLITILAACTLILFLIFSSIVTYRSALAQQEFAETEFVEEGKPKLFDAHLKITTIVKGLNTPTTMAFVGPDDILVLDKDTGMVKRIVNGTVLTEPVLDVSVANSVERCLCGIAVSTDYSKTYVFLSGGK